MFVDGVVQREVLRETVKTIQDRNAAFDQQVILNLVEEAVDRARANSVREESPENRS